MILIVNNYSDSNIFLGDFQMKDIGERIQRMTGKDFMVERYYKLSAHYLAEHPQITAVILGGCNSRWDDVYFDVFEGEFDLIKTANIPILGICAGLQLMAMAYNGSARRCDFGKEERGFTDITINTQSALTAGMNSVYAFEYHYCMVPELPEGFECLMSSRKTPIQAMKRIGEHKYGVQFHPELDHEAADPLFRARSLEAANGKQVLLNFLALTDEAPHA